MTSLAIDALAAVRAVGGEVKFAGPGRLKVVASAPLPDDLIRRLRAAKPELLALLSTDAQAASDNSVSSPSTTNWGEVEEERAATIEYDGGVPRPWAEGFARLDPSKAPGSVPPHRWQRFIDDCGRFLDFGWAERAATLGWGPLQLFGCDRERPYYFPPRGLIWEVTGGRLVELHRDRAIIEIRGGTCQRYKRQPVEVGRVVLPWELM